MGGLAWCKAEIGNDIDGDITPAIILPTSKTDQYNEGEKKVLEALGRNICPVRMFPKWKTVPTVPMRDRSLAPTYERD